MKFYVNCFDAPIDVCRCVSGNPTHFTFNRLENFSFYTRYKGKIVKVVVRDNVIKANLDDDVLTMDLSDKSYANLYVEDDFVRIISGVNAIISESLNYNGSRQTIKYKGKSINTMEIKLETCKLCEVGMDCNPLFFIDRIDLEVLDRMYNEMNDAFDLTKLPINEFVLAVKGNAELGNLDLKCLFKDNNFYMSEYNGDSYVVEDIVGYYNSMEEFIRKFRFAKKYCTTNGYELENIDEDDLSYLFSVLKYINNMFRYCEDRVKLVTTVAESKLHELDFNSEMFNGVNGATVFTFNGLHNKRSMDICQFVKDYDRKLRNGTVKHFPAVVKFRDASHLHGLGLTEDELSVYSLH